MDTGRTTSFTSHMDKFGHPRAMAFGLPFLVAASALIPHATAKISGEWVDQLGVVYAVREDSGQVLARYKHKQARGVLSGTLIGRVFRGTYVENKGKLNCPSTRTAGGITSIHWGTFTLTFNARFTRFSGHYSHCGRKETRPWRGQLVGPVHIDFIGAGSSRSPLSKIHLGQPFFVRLVFDRVTKPREQIELRQLNRGAKLRLFAKEVRRFVLETGLVILTLDAKTRRTRAATRFAIVPFQGVLEARAIGQMTKRVWIIFSPSVPQFDQKLSQRARDADRQLNREVARERADFERSTSARWEKFVAGQMKNAARIQDAALRCDRVKLGQALFERDRNLQQMRNDLIAERKRYKRQRAVARAQEAQHHANLDNLKRRWKGLGLQERSAGPGETLLKSAATSATERYKAINRIETLGLKLKRLDLLLSKLREMEAKPPKPQKVCN